ncbi:Receptor expression-enhancing protein [Caenorhabditis elegans]|uniref:Receptor expression-enhancing protein n=1 Tax=Caenorhabditis elegans TaxID=6239 RepID=O45108_CAEEL|nr:Receptor expression-enhancing protein [Caenorhabditis elegans]CCD71942.1 Receptor expression-enhancing protein [Caenorhabditis elegans]|eukprot:NP_499990.1 Receptor expression-enhancing protein [Caenorhabditis elegans]
MSARGNTSAQNRAASALGAAASSTSGQPAETPRAALKRHVAPTEGLAVAQNDIHNFLFESHGQIFDMAMMYAESAGFKRDHLSYAAFGLIAFFLVFGSVARLLCNLIGFGYPTYASVKAIRSPGGDDDTVWLIYWTCFAVLYLVDFFSEAILSWFPFYYIAKACFLVYLYLPQTQGSVMFYETIVDPLVIFVDKNLDKFYYNRSN